jgi:phage-related protein
MLKKLRWIGSSKSDLKSMPLAVKREIGFSLHQAQEGKMPLNAKPLKEIAAGVIEIVSDYNKNTYRAVYVLKLSDAIYVLHSFQKKSKSGIKTPKLEIDLIKQRLALSKKDVLRKK